MRLAAVLTLLFVGLKMTEYITWSWWWILSPFPIYTLMWSIIIIVICGLALCLGLRPNVILKNNNKNKS